MYKFAIATEINQVKYLAHNLFFKKACYLSSSFEFFI